jgi:predicted ester cyclase
MCAAVGLAATALTACGSSSSTQDRTDPAVAASTPSMAPVTGLVDRSGDLVVPGSGHVDTGMSHAQAAHVVQIAQTLYTFWNTGDSKYLDRAIEPSFRDNTRPAGRPQGPDGPIAASATFRAAVPDLTCRLADLYVIGDSFAARLVFRGHFTGTDNGIVGKGQSIDFNAIDIQHLGDGQKITEDWHLEDNLTFLQQADLVSITGSK